MVQRGETENNKNQSAQGMGDYLKADREHLEVGKEPFAKGLSAKSMVSNLEAGEKNAGWLLQERFLQRGRTTEVSYEKYLDNRECVEWEEREKILDFLEEGDAQKMKDALGKYADKYGLKRVGRDPSIACQDAYRTDGDVMERLRRQFYLGMFGKCQMLSGRKPEKCTLAFEAAVRQSVPEFDREPLQCLTLCAEEIDLILEYAQSLPLADTCRWCRKAKEYLEDERMDDDTRVLNYPKTIWILCRTLQKKDGEGMETCAQVLRLCGSAIQLLRKTKKAYYLLEILEIKRNTLEYMQKFHVEKGEPQRAGALQKMLNETKDWLWHIGGLYERFGVRRGQGSDAYLYRGQDIFHAGEMVYNRRNMLGMTRRQLQEGLVCSVDTIKNLERKKCSTYPFHMREICKKIGLSPVNARTELVAPSREARDLEKEIRYAMNDRKFEENLEQIGRLKEMIDMSEPINQQWVLRTEGMAKHELGQIGDEEYEEVVKQALECTLPMSIIEYPDEKPCYLTNSEMESIYHYSLLIYRGDAEEAYRRMKVVFRLEDGYERAGKAKNHVRTYELYMKYKASLLCEMGEYEQAKEQVEKAIPVCLCAGRINMLDGLLYTWIRSNMEIQTKKTEPQKAKYEWRKDLECCLALSQFCYNNVRKEFYERVWKGIVSDKN